jgi:5,10-methylene-tetrahydrofolate dehydrogenase/methenyl tetrahydrofolate cyclohydrolase
MYADFTQKTSLECGFRFDTRQVNKEDLEDGIMDANGDKDVDGIMVYFPVFGDRQVKSDITRLIKGSIFTTMYGHPYVKF